MTKLYYSNDHYIYVNKFLVSLFFISSLMSKWIQKLDDWLNNKETLTPLPEKDVFQLCNLVSIVASSSFLGQRNTDLRAKYKIHSGARRCRWGHSWAIFGLGRDF